VTGALWGARPAQGPLSRGLQPKCHSSLSQGSSVVPPGDIPGPSSSWHPSSLYKQSFNKLSLKQRVHLHPARMVGDLNLSVVQGQHKHSWRQGLGHKDSKCKGPVVAIPQDTSQCVHVLA
jgi:hypothetical protein